MKINLACIIDDDEIYVYGVKCIMNMVDFTKDLIVFENGEDALNYFKPIMDDPDAIPDVILLDINMPIMDGWEFLDEFIKIQKVIEKTVTIYMMSSSVNPVDLEKAKTYESISDYIVKPVSLESLTAIMKMEE